jgi:hypothetical protein
MFIVQCDWIHENYGIPINEVKVKITESGNIRVGTMVISWVAPEWTRRDVLGTLFACQWAIALAAISKTGKVRDALPQFVTVCPV